MEKKLIKIHRLLEKNGAEYEKKLRKIHQKFADSCTKYHKTIKDAKNKYENAILTQNSQINKEIKIFEAKKQSILDKKKKIINQKAS